MFTILRLNLLTIADTTRVIFEIKCTRTMMEEWKVLHKQYGRRLLRGQVHDGWNNQFTPTVAGMYDVNFTVTNPTSESSSYVFEDLVFIWKLPEDKFFSLNEFR